MSQMTGVNLKVKAMLGLECTHSIEEYETGHWQTFCVAKKLIPIPGDDKLTPRIHNFRSSVLYRKAQNLLRLRRAWEHSI